MPAALTGELSRYVLPLADFDGLALQARDPGRAATFWQHNLPASTFDRNQLRLDPSPVRARAEILRLLPSRNLAGDPARVHVDIRLPGADPAGLIEAGATVIREPGDDPWWVLADPEGNQFCAFPRWTTGLQAYSSWSSSAMIRTRWRSGGARF